MFGIHKAAFNPFLQRSYKADQQAALKTLYCEYIFFEMQVARLPNQKT